MDFESPSLHPEHFLNHYQQPQPDMQDQYSNEHAASCLMRAGIVDSCFKSRFLFMMMHYYFLSKLTDPNAPCRCPMLRCPRRLKDDALFPDAAAMMKHLQEDCNYWKEQEFVCPCCNDPHSFPISGKPQCSWTHGTWKRGGHWRNLVQSIRRPSSRRSCHSPQLALSASALEPFPMQREPSTSMSLYETAADVGVALRMPSGSGSGLPQAVGPAELEAGSSRREGRTQIRERLSLASRPVYSPTRRASELTGEARTPTSAQNQSSISSHDSWGTQCSSWTTDNRGSAAAEQNSRPFPIQVVSNQSSADIPSTSFLPQSDWGCLATFRSDDRHLTQPQQSVLGRTLTASPVLMDQNESPTQSSQQYGAGYQNPQHFEPAFIPAELHEDFTSQTALPDLALDARFSSELSAPDVAQSFGTTAFGRDLSVLRAQVPTSDPTSSAARQGSASSGQTFADSGISDHHFIGVHDFTPEIISASSQRQDSVTLPTLDASQSAARYRYKCPYRGCPYVATSGNMKANLAKHVQRRHQQRPQHHRCDVCGKLFKNRLDNLQKHQREKHGVPAQLSKTKRHLREPEGGEAEGTRVKRCRACTPKGHGDHSENAGTQYGESSAHAP